MLTIDSVMKVNPAHLYELYQCNRENKLPDLTIGMAYYRDQHPEITQEEDDAMIGFISRHSRALAKAFPDQTEFYSAWADGVADDLRRIQEKEESESEE